MNIDVMSASYIQAERIIRVETALGPDVLLPERLSMHEKVSGLFELTIAVNSKRTDIAPDELVGKLADVSVDTGFGDRRTWNGLVTELIEGPGVTRGLRAYTLVLRPEHWLLSQRSDCRIWLDKTSVEVAQILMGEHSLASPVTKGIVTPPPAQHYSVQFNETDLAYLTRRLEEDGIFYWFEHEGGSPGSVSAKHTLHLASDISGYVTGPETDVRFAMGSADRNHVTKFEKRFRYLPGRRAGADWNFETPNRVPGGDTPSLVKLPKNDGYELYEYPSLAGYGSGTRASEGIDNDAVERQSKLRMMSSEADHQRSEGASTVRTLSPGRRFKPYDVANPTNIFDEQVIIEIVHTAHDRSYATNEEGEPEYQNAFVAIPSKVPATPHRTTRRPKIEGTQVALVAGPEGEEIHPDEYGRIKVWFPWDRRAKKDGSDTCWIRVAQNWAGAGWGGQIIPRIGMEVMVTHLDGDPDRPLVTGVVPNAKQKVPYKLPENKTKSVFRTNTHKSKDKRQMNELSFEDREAEEEVFIHAQKDRNEKTLNNHTERIDNNWMQSVGRDKAIQVDNNHDEIIGNNMTLSIGRNRLHNFIPVEITKLWTGIGDAARNVRSFASKIPSFGNWHIYVQNSVLEFIGFSYSRSVAKDFVSSVGGNQNNSIEGSLEVSVGGFSSESVNGVKIIQSDEHIDIVAGGSSIHLYKDGTIVIDGKQLFIDIQGKVEINGSRIDIN